MNYCIKNHKGVTLVEILVSAVILALVIVAAYAAFISTVKLSTFSEDELEAYVNASTWLEKVRSGVDDGTDDTKYDSLSAQADIDLNDAASVMQEDYINDWPLPEKANVNMTGAGLGATYTTEENINIAGTGIPFKRITAKVVWEEED